MDPSLLLSLVLGLSVGSFLNVLISRLPDPERSLLRPARSECPKCQIEVRARDNVPILSYLWLRGRCRGCRASIGLTYPLVEASTAGVFVLSYLAFGPTIHALHAAVFVTILIGIAVTDAQTYLIPDLYTVGGAAAGIAFALLRFGVAGVVTAALDAVLVAGGLWLLGWVVSAYVRRKRAAPPAEGEPDADLGFGDNLALGFGDVLVVGMMATFLGLGNTLISIYLGAVSGVLVFIVHRALRAKRLIPLGLYLALGGVLGFVLEATQWVPGFSAYAHLLNSFLPWH